MTSMMTGFCGVDPRDNPYRRYRAIKLIIGQIGLDDELENKINIELDKCLNELRKLSKNLILYKGQDKHFEEFLKIKERDENSIKTYLK